MTARGEVTANRLGTQKPQGEHHKPEGRYRFDARQPATAQDGSSRAYALIMLLAAASSSSPLTSTEHRHNIGGSRDHGMFNRMTDLLEFVHHFSPA